jgi:hypothetical protein
VKLRGVLVSNQVRLTFARQPSLPVQASDLTVRLLLGLLRVNNSASKTDTKDIQLGVEDFEVCSLS